MFVAEWGLLWIVIAADVFRVEHKLKNLAKGIIEITLGPFEDAQGILQREVMSYLAITCFVSHYTESRSLSQQLRKKKHSRVSAMCVWMCGRAAKEATDGEKAKYIPQPQVEGCGS